MEKLTVAEINSQIEQLKNTPAIIEATKNSWANTYPTVNSDGKIDGIVVEFNEYDLDLNRLNQNVKYTVINDSYAVLE